MNLLKRFFHKRVDVKKIQEFDSSTLDKLISNAVEAKFDDITSKVISDVNDLKADYLKRYLDRFRAWLFTISCRSAF